MTDAHSPLCPQPLSVLTHFTLKHAANHCLVSQQLGYCPLVFYLPLPDSEWTVRGPTHRASAARNPPNQPLLPVLLYLPPPDPPSAFLAVIEQGQGCHGNDSVTYLSPKTQTAQTSCTWTCAAAGMEGRGSKCWRGYTHNVRAGVSSAGCQAGSKTPTQILPVSRTHTHTPIRQLRGGRCTVGPKCDGSCIRVCGGCAEASPRRRAQLSRRVSLLRGLSCSSAILTPLCFRRSGQLRSGV